MAAQVRSIRRREHPRDPDHHHGASSSSVSPSARDAHAAGHPRRRLARPPSERSQVRIRPSASPKRGRRRGRTRWSDFRTLRDPARARLPRCPGVGPPPPSCSRGACSSRAARARPGPRRRSRRPPRRSRRSGLATAGAPPRAAGAGGTGGSGRPCGTRRRCAGRSAGAPAGCCARRSPASGRGRSTRCSSAARATASGASPTAGRRCGSGPPPRRTCTTPPARPCPSATSRAGARSSPTTSGPPCRSGASRPRWPSAGGPTPRRTTTPRTTGPTTPGARRGSAAGCCGSTSTRRAAGRACRRPSRGSRARRGAATALPGACATGGTPCASARPRWPATRRPGCSGRTPGAGRPTARSTSPRGTSTPRSAPTCTTPGRRAEATRTPSTPGNTYGGWHTATTEWTPGLVRFFLDHRLVGATRSRVPSTPMHWVLQTETRLSGGAPPASAAGDVLVDWVTAYRR